MTESVSPYMTTASYGYPLAFVYRSVTMSLVFIIISLPNPVTEADISKHGNCPTYAPVNPYTELALTFSAS